MWYFKHCVLQNLNVWVMLSWVIQIQRYRDVVPVSRLSDMFRGNLTTYSSDSTYETETVMLLVEDQTFLWSELINQPLQIQD